MTVLPDGRLAAVQDEAGLLYILDGQTGAVVEERPFAGPGDYEDVEYVDGTVWVLQANGSLYELPEGGAPQEHDTPLKKKCDAEGLTLDRTRTHLLIACKEDPGEGLDENSVRAIYAFDLSTRQLAPEPAVVLSRATLDDGENFKPSALAVHPQTGELYVLSSVRKAIAVVAADGTVTMVPLSERLHAQPEGLAFTPDGALYLSNEGPDGPALVYRFDPQNG